MTTFLFVDCNDMRLAQPLISALAALDNINTRSRQSLKLLPRIQRISSLLALSALLGLNASSVLAETIVSEQTSEGAALSLPIYSWADAAVPTKAIILAIHGVTLYSGNFDKPAKHLASEGYPVYAVDMRGFGRWQAESSKFAGDSGIHYNQSQEDLENVLKKLRSEYVDKKIYILGESIGANLALWLAAKDPDLVDGVILSSPCIKVWIHPKPRMIVDTIHGLLFPNTRQGTKPYLRDYMSEDKRVTNAYYADPLIVHRLSPVETFKSLKTNTRTLLSIKDISPQLPVLIVAGKLDRIYKAKAIPEFVQQLGSENKTVVIEEKKGHLLLETKFIEPDVLTVIDTWLAKTVPVQTAEKPADRISSAASSVNKIDMNATQVTSESIEAAASIKQ